MTLKQPIPLLDSKLGEELLISLEIYIIMLII